MAGSQQEIDFGDAARLEAHLVRCGFSPAQAALAALVFREGARRELGGGECVWVLEISSRQAARLLGKSDRIIAKAAATLAREEWFRVVRRDPRSPPAYVLDVVGARSRQTPRDELDELITHEPARPDGDEPRSHLAQGRYDKLAAHRCAPGAHQVRTSPVSHTREDLTKTRFLSPHLSCQGLGEVRSGSHQCAPRHDDENAAGRMLWRMGSGVTDLELVRAVRTRDVPLLRAMFDQAVRLGWIEFASDDAWLRFLTAVHHAATARLWRRMGRLVVFVQRDGLDVSKCRQASDDWAGQVVRDQRRDPQLVAMGRLNHGGD